MKVSVSRSRHNQFFALPGSPPSRVEVGGAAYRLVRVFKHDFFCATCLYELTESPGGTGGALPKIVVKFGRQQWFGPLPLAWYGRANARHEQSIYRALAGVRGVPRLAGSVGDSALAIEFIDSRPLDHAPPPPAGFFDRLRELFDAIHARGVAYTDSNKRSNILIAANGEPFLIDYQISLRRRDDWPWPLRTLLGAAVAYLQGKDLYHLQAQATPGPPGPHAAGGRALTSARWIASAAPQAHQALSQPPPPLPGQAVRGGQTHQPHRPPGRPPPAREGNLAKALRDVTGFSGKAQVWCDTRDNVATQSDRGTEEEATQEESGQRLSTARAHEFVTGFLFVVLCPSVSLCRVMAVNRLARDFGHTRPERRRGRSLI